jgi:copper resistance protein D
MFSLPGNWELVSLLAKLLHYVGVFSIAGGTLVAWRYSNSNRAVLFSAFSYIFFGSILGFHGALLGFLVQVGLINDSGLGGMIDWGMSSILLDTGLGDVTLLRLLAFSLSGISSVIVLRKLQRSNIDLQDHRIRLLFIWQIVALAILAFSHRVTGHVSVLSAVGQISIVLHVAAFALWIGCLYPFLQLSKSADLALLQKTLKRFGDDAIVILFVLFLGGALMILELLESPMALFNTDYGLALLTKLILVMIILGIAAVNKLLIVPPMLSAGSAGKLQASIRVESLVALAILVVTSYLSTIVGPASHQM